MAIRTALTEALGLEYPIVLAPMASVSGARLAAAVSDAGGLGLIGGGYGDPDWLRANGLDADDDGDPCEVDDGGGGGGSDGQYQYDDSSVDTSV